MRKIKGVTLMLICIFSMLSVNVLYPTLASAAKVEKTESSDKLASSAASFNANMMSDMSDYDPGNPVVPTGDTIKIAVVASHSGPASIQGPGLLCFGAMGGS